MLATCRSTISRRDPNAKTPSGDPAAVYNTVATNVLASIQPRQDRVFDQATQTPRIVRSVDGWVPYGTDIQVTDRIHDDRYGVTYVVNNVTQPRAPGRYPDIELDLTRVN